MRLALSSPSVTAGEILVEIEIEIVVEIDDESFILRIAGLHESNGGFVDAGTLVAHAAAIVDHQPHADGHILALEDREFLFHFVFEDAKIFRLQAIGETLAIVDDGRVQNDQIDVESNFRPLPTDVGILAGRWRRAIGRRKLCKRARTKDSGHAEK